MKIPRCDLHAKQQTIAMVDTETGEFTEKTLSHGHEQPQRVRHRILAPRPSLSRRCGQRCGRSCQWLRGLWIPKSLPAIIAK